MKRCVLRSALLRSRPAFCCVHVALWYLVTVPCNQCEHTMGVSSVEAPAGTVACSLCNSLPTVNSATSRHARWTDTCHRQVNKAKLYNDYVTKSSELRNFHDSRKQQRVAFSKSDEVCLPLVVDITKLFLLDETGVPLTISTYTLGLSIAVLLSSYMLYHMKAHISLCFFLLLPSYSDAVNFPQCLAEVTSCATNPTGQSCAFNISNVTALSILRTSNGSPIDTVTDPNITETATALSYAGCVEYCGKGSEPFNWPSFLQDCTSWLLPYLALLSQLPFGARHRLDSLMSALLTLGSPTLAGYSLFLTLLNSRWLNSELFSEVKYPSSKTRKSVVHVLSMLQQVPVRVHPGLPLAQFESLVVHPDNDKWWSTLEEELNYSESRTITSAVSIIWVVVIYVLTVTESFLSLQGSSSGTTRGTGSAWIWLLPIVVSWLAHSPKCDYKRVHDAYEKANKLAAAPSHTDGTTNIVTSNFGLTIKPNPGWEDDSRRNIHTDISSRDELLTPPIFNYARTLGWSRTVYVTSLFYREAEEKSRNRKGVDGERISGSAGNVPSESRNGSKKQIAKYCTPDRGLDVLWPRGIFLNMIVASLMSLLLQWGTTSSAVIADWFTPTIGLGCRSLAYLTFGGISTIVWFQLVLSNAIGYYADHLKSNSSNSNQTQAPETDGIEMDVRKPLMAEAEEGNVPSTNTASGSSTSLGTAKRGGPPSLWWIRSLTFIANLLMWIGKTLAIINAVGLFANSILEFAEIYDNCYCDSSVLTWGNYAYNVITYDTNIIQQATSAWKGALALAIFSCTFFVGTVFLLRDSVPS